MVVFKTRQLCKVAWEGTEASWLGFVNVKHPRAAVPFLFFWTIILKKTPVILFVNCLCWMWNKDGRNGGKNQNNNKNGKKICWIRPNKVSIFENVWFSRRDISNVWSSSVWGGESYSCFNHYQLHFTPKMTYLKTEFIVDCKYEKHQCYYFSMFLYGFCVLYILKLFQ